MGLFHLKMACADAIWRLFIHPRGARNDPNSLINLIGQIRPKETGKIESGPGFHQMHEAIQHIGIVLCLDAWHIATAKVLDGNVESLKDFANLKPAWEATLKLLKHLCQDYVAVQSHVLSRERRRPVK